MSHSKAKLFIWLFGINLFISSFTFGGGYVVVPMIRKYFVQHKKLFNEEDLMNMAAIAQSTPGAIAINLSALAGYQTGGTMGAVISCLGALLPPLFMLSFISVFYAAFSANIWISTMLKGMQAGALAVIVDLCIDMTNMILKKRSLLLTFMVPAAFFANFFLNINVIIILAISCILCVVQVYRKKGGQTL